MKLLRRIIIFLAIIISVLWIEAAHADMSGPELREFEIVVINPNGVDYYDYKGVVAGHLNKGEKAIVMYEYNGQYTIGSTEKNQYGNYEQIGYINSITGFSIVQDEVDPTKLTNDESITKYDENQKALVYASEGVDIYKGPADVYEKVGHIKKGETLTYKYSIDTFDDVTNIYVEYNGVKGWVEVLKGKVLIQNNTQYIFANDVTSECGTVPRNSITTPNYKTDQWSHETLFEYNGCEFMHNSFRDDDIYNIFTWDSNVTTIKDVVLYEYADNTSKVVGTIPTGSKVQILASNEVYGKETHKCYVKYNDTFGWAVYNDEIFEYNNNSEPTESEIKIEDTIKIDEVILPQYEEIKPSPIKGVALNTFILLCGFGVGILVITALVIIILINRKKKTEAPVEQKEEK